MASRMKDMLLLCGFGMMAEVANTIMTWTPWFPHKILSIAVICIFTFNIVVVPFLGRQDVGLVGIHKEIDYIKPRECLASAEIIGDLTFGENLPCRVDIECYNVVTILNICKLLAYVKY